MKRNVRKVLWIVGAVAVAAVVAASIPGSPVYLPDALTSRADFQGKSASRWAADLDDPDPAARKQAIFALGSIGADAGGAVPRLARIMVEDPDVDARLQASLALSKMDPASRAAVPELARALGDADKQVRMNAARALFRLREDARPAVPALRQALQDKANREYVNPRLNVTVQEQVALALGRASAGTAEAVPDLTDALKTAETDGVRQAVARALGEVGPPARAAAEDLRKLLKHPTREVQEAAADALEKIEGVRPALPELPPQPPPGGRPQGAGGGPPKPPPGR